MSVFRFMDLPEEVGILIAHEAAMAVDVGPDAIRLADYSDYRDDTQALAELSLVSSIFRNPVQEELFSIVKIMKVVRVRELLGILRSNPRLCRWVKGLLLETGNAYNENGQRESLLESMVQKDLEDLLGICVSLKSIIVRYTEVRLKTLSRAKALKYLYLEAATLNSEEVYLPFENLVTVGCVYSTLDFEPDGLTEQSYFPSLTCISCMDSDDIVEFINLFPLIETLSISVEEIKSLTNDDYLLDLTDLKKIELFNPETAEQVVQVLEKINQIIPSVLEHIQIHKRRGVEGPRGEWNWKLLEDWFEREDSIGLNKLELISVIGFEVDQEGKDFLTDGDALYDLAGILWAKRIGLATTDHFITFQ